MGGRVGRCCGEQEGIGLGYVCKMRKDRFIKIDELKKIAFQKELNYPRNVENGFPKMAWPVGSMWVQEEHPSFLSQRTGNGKCL